MRVSIPAVLLVWSLSAVGSPSGPPVAPKKPVVDTYHGVRITDDYQWLENWDDPEVKAWSEAQNAWTRSYLDRIPAAPAIRARLAELRSSPSPDYQKLAAKGGLLFAIKKQPPKEQPFLVALRTENDTSTERIVVDPNVIDKKGGVSIDWFVPSRNGKLVAVCMSKGGSEDGSLHVYETASGRKLPDLIERVNYGTAGGSVAWNADGTGLYYTRYPRKGEREGRDRLFYQQVWFHKLGTPETADRYSLGREFPKIAEIDLDSSEDGRYILASVSDGDGGEYAHWVLSPAGEWTQVTKFSDAVVRAKFGADGALYMLSRKDAPRGKILRLAPATPSLEKATVVAEAGEGTIAITDFEPAANRMFVVDIDGGPTRIRMFDLSSFHGIADGEKAPIPMPGERATPRELGLVVTPPLSSIGEVLHLKGDEILFRSQTYLSPPAWYRYRAGATRPVKTALRRTSPANYSDTEVHREFAVAKDGARIPINIIRRSGAPSGPQPTILYGYGGYGINLTPTFLENARVWIEQGGVYAVANLRGGGEYGEGWHKQGNLTRKQTVFDDFAAVAEHLIAAGYTSREKLAIEGRSNGGLLMGAALTQHPGLYRAVVAHVGIYDMLRVELAPNGEFNTTEFGTVKDEAQFKALRDYSPFHRVTDGAKYPAVLFLTGANDPRVDPMHSRKMTARLQTATASGRPVLLRTSATTGHGIGSGLSAELLSLTDSYAFLFDQLGVPYVPVARSGKTKTPGNVQGGAGNGEPPRSQR